jgi:tryptophan synthase beta subunit
MHGIKSYMLQIEKASRPDYSIASGLSILLVGPEHAFLKDTAA